jgi:predicted nuclease of predicted toxin-antitoxin system
VSAVCCSSHCVPTGCGLKLWLDAQMPPALANWIAERFDVEASNLDAVGLRHARDAQIFAVLGEAGHVIVSKAARQGALRLASPSWRRLHPYR